MRDEKRDSGRFVIISGCSGGGKSTLIAQLAQRGFATVAEPGRRIVADELAHGGSALPWADAPSFARRLVETAWADLERAKTLPGPVFFDRGLVDAAAALDHLCRVPVARTLADAPRFHAIVFLAPPWPEIFANDAERRHAFDAAAAEFDRLAALYPRLGYETRLLPRAGVEARADVVLAAVGPR